MCIWLRAQTNWHHGGIVNIKGDSWVLWLFQSCTVKFPQCCRADVVRGRWNISQLRNDQPGAQSSFRSWAAAQKSFLLPTQHTQDWCLRQTRACVQHLPAALLSPAAYLLHASPLWRISSSMPVKVPALIFAHQQHRSCSVLHTFQNTKIPFLEFSGARQHLKGTGLCSASSWPLWRTYVGLWCSSVTALCQACVGPQQQQSWHWAAPGHQWG